MSNTFAGNINIGITGTLSTTGNLETASDSASAEANVNFANGTGLNKAQNFITRSGVLGSNESIDIDLLASSNLLGTVVFSKIKGIAIYNMTSTYTSQLYVRPSASSGWMNWCEGSQDQVYINALGSFALTSPVSGIDVSAGNSKLHLSNIMGGGSITYKIIVIGE